MTTATTEQASSKVISSTSARAQAIIAKAKAKEQATAPLLTAKEVIEAPKPTKATTHLSGKPLLKNKAEEFDVDANAEGVKQHNKKPTTKPTTKKVAKPKEAKGPLFTCSEAMGIVMKANPKATAEVLTNKADSLYIKKTGKESNLFQMGKYHQFATHFLKGYNAK